MAMGVEAIEAPKSIGVRDRRVRSSRLSTRSRTLDFLLVAAAGEERRLVDNLMLHLSRW